VTFPNSGPCQRAAAPQSVRDAPRWDIICFLEEIYTPVERTLIDAGRFDAVRETRSAFQDTMRKRFVTAVEELGGRKVVGFLSQVHVDPDLAAETFILEASSDGGDAATGGWMLEPLMATLG
jgi:uncharacterized protein YbcI